MEKALQRRFWSEITLSKQMEDIRVLQRISEGCWIGQG